MYLPDPIERMKARIDELIEDQFASVPAGKIRCYECRKVVSVDEVESASAAPDAPAICWDCCDKFFGKGYPDALS